MTTSFLHARKEEGREDEEGRGGRGGEDAGGAGGNREEEVLSFPCRQSLSNAVKEDVM